MNVKQIAQFTTEGLKAVKSMPLAGKVAVGALFGAGALVGGIIGDAFEKEDVKENVVNNTVSVKPQKQKAPAEAKKEPAFKYVLPEIGKNGIVSADTTYYEGTDKISSIDYLDKDSKLVQSTSYDKNGNFDGFSTWSRGLDGDLDFQVTSYDKNGNCINVYEEYKDGSSFNRHYSEDGTFLNSCNYDTKGRQTSQEDKDGNSSKIVYNQDGSKTTTHYEYSTPEWQTTESKDGKLLKEKEYNSDGTLKHTIIPRYNKEGDVVRRDTIPNK